VEGARSTVLDAVENSTRSSIAGNFEEIISHSFVQACYPGLNTSTACALYSALGSYRLHKLAELIFTDPYTYRNGWPDLTLVQNNMLLFVEVKTTDKLHKSQLTSFPAIRKAIDADIRVVVLRTTSSKRARAIPPER
jgi:hypothetical protein